MELLSQLQNEILSNFGEIIESDLFYFTGGTALALFYLKHRQSNDLDFFTSREEIILPFSFRLEEKLKSLEIKVERLTGLHSFVELSLRKKGGITKIHLAKDSPFRFKAPIKASQYPNIKVDSLKDIASNKLLTLFQRATPRDFIDVYFLIKEKYFTIKELMLLAKEKDPGFDLYWLGVAFERINLFAADSPEMLLLIKKCSFEELLSFFNKWREEISRSLK